MHPRGYSSYTQALTCFQSSKCKALPDKDQAALPRQLRAKPRSLNNCTPCHTQASQVSIWLGDQFGLGILKGMINLLVKPDERYSFNILTAECVLSD